MCGYNHPTYKTSSLNDFTGNDDHSTFKEEIIPALSTQTQG